MSDAKSHVTEEQKVTKECEQQSTFTASDSSAADSIYVTKHRSTFSMWLHGKSLPSRTAPSVVFRSADVIRQGYLYKQGLRLKMWSKRYFILRLEERHMTLGYYLTKESLVLCSETPIGPGHSLRCLDKYTNRLELCWGTKSMVLEAETNELFLLWKSALEEAIRWNHTMILLKDGTSIKYGNKVEQDIQKEELNRLEAAKKLEKKHRQNDNVSSKLEYLPSNHHGMQCFKTSNTRFEIPTYYEYIKTIGSGAYGVVISAKDTRSNESVAIKNIQKAFDDLTDAKRIVREIKLMRHLNHNNVLGIYDILQPLSMHKYEDVYIVSELMNTDLHRVIYSRHALSEEHLAYFLYQMLCAIKYIHSANVIHRDLKPSNILVNANCELKICDFGLARGIVLEEELELTEYVVTRWYRAPEIMLGCMKYTRAVDVWSIGCIFAEMMSRKPLFPGQDYIDQLHLIMNALGALPDHELCFIHNARARKFMVSEYTKRGPTPNKSLAQMFAEVPSKALDLLQQMLVLDPNKRISIDGALSHPFLSSVRNVKEETTAETAFDFDFENENLTKPVLQELIYNEMCHYHPEAKNKLSTCSLKSNENGYVTENLSSLDSDREACADTESEETFHPNQ